MNANLQDFFLMLKLSFLFVFLPCRTTYKMNDTIDFLKFYLGFKVVCILHWF